MSSFLTWVIVPKYVFNRGASLITRRSYLDEYLNKVLNSFCNIKWDWWVIGGSWSGYMNRDNKENENIFSIKTLILSPDIIPFAIIDLNKNWHERASIGWFSTTSKEKEHQTWFNEVYDIIKTSNQESSIVIIECHT